MLPIVEVTLYEDRASVVREGTIPVEAGLNRVRVEAVCPVLSDKTLAGEVLSGDGELADLRIERKKVVRSPDLEPLEEELRRAAEQTRRVGGRLERAVGLVDRLDEAQRLTAAEIAEDAGWAKAEPAAWGDRLDSLRSAREAARAEQLELEQTLARARQEEKDRSVRVELARRSPAATKASDLVVSLAATSPGELRLRVEYIVPGACWRPWHRARLGEESLRFEATACVWQNTGEDWQDVRLYFSTERASLGVEPPELSPDRLALRRIGATVHVETRQQTVEQTGVGGGTVKAAEVPGIDDGGAPMRLSAARRATIVSDGRPVRVPLFEFEAAAERELRLAAELDVAVLLRTEHANEAGLPLLPGPVDLVRDSGYVGQTNLEYTAAAERFELGWGPELALRVHRELVRVPQEARLLSSWSSTRHDLELRLSNIGPEPKRIHVRERVPISEIDKVKITFDEKKTSGREVPDRDGFVHWSVELAGHSTTKRALSYTIAQHSDVVGL